MEHPTSAVAHGIGAPGNTMGSSVGLEDINRKRGLSEMEGVDDYDDDDDESGGGDSKDGIKRALGKRSRRHNWQPKYEMEFGLLAIERDPPTGDVTLAMCGFCKAFGREGKYDQGMLQADADAGTDVKKRRRRSLTTTKFFRAFRVDNIRCHLMGAHPRRWCEYEMLPKQEAVRSRYLQMHGEYQYDGLPVDDASLHTEQESVYGSSAMESTQGETPSSQIGSSSNGLAAMALRNKISVGSRSQFDYEKHLMDQLALDREKFEFEKTRFKQEMELREREFLQRKRMMEQDEKLHLERQQMLVAESAKFAHLAEAIRHLHAPVV